MKGMSVRKKNVSSQNGAAGGVVFPISCRPMFRRGWKRVRDGHVVEELSGALFGGDCGRHWGQGDGGWDSRGGECFCLSDKGNI